MSAFVSLPSPACRLPPVLTLPRHLRRLRASRPPRIARVAWARGSHAIGQFSFKLFSRPFDSLDPPHGTRDTRRRRLRQRSRGQRLGLGGGNRGFDFRHRLLDNRLLDLFLLRFRQWLVFHRRRGLCPPCAAHPRSFDTGLAIVRQAPHLGLQVLEQPRNVLVATEDQQLMPRAGEVSQHQRRRLGTPDVEIHQHVVQHQRQPHAASCIRAHQRQPQRQEQLLARAPAQQLDIEAVAF